MADSPLDILVSYQQKIINALVESLEKNDRVKGGQLSQSIKVNVKAFATSFQIEINLLDYWRFVDKGVDGWEKSVGSPYKFKKDGKPIPEKAMAEFMAENGIVPAMNIKAHKKSMAAPKKERKGIVKKNKANALRSAGYAFGKNIKRRGIKPTHFLSEAMDGGIFADLTKDLSAALSREITIILKTPE